MAYHQRPTSGPTSGLTTYHKPVLEFILENEAKSVYEKMRKDKRDIASTFVTPLSPFGEMEKKNTKHLQVEAAEAAERGAAFFKFGLKAQMKWKVMWVRSRIEVGVSKLSHRQSKTV